MPSAHPRGACRREPPDKQPRFIGVTIPDRVFSREYFWRVIPVMDREQITAEVAARLVAGQFPQWAGLPVIPVGLGGWDNITFRLGQELSVRLPSGQDYAAQVAKEHRWLPVLAGQLPLPVPDPVALGQPAAGVPW